jgi:serine protease Do
MSSTFLAGTELGAAAAEVAAKLTNSVVQVTTNGHGVGAGTIWRPDGLIVTNHHVTPRSGAQVVLHDGRRLEAAVVARDQPNDLALLRVEAGGLPAAAIADARALRVGELVLAVGHPFGLREALTIGVVSAVIREQEVGRFRELIRADVLLGPGNSGGPLADARGRVVGINAMVAGGLGLAVPSHLVERLVQAGAPRPALGIGLREVELQPSLAQLAGAARALLVVKVASGGPAERGGVLLGDLVLEMAGRRIRTVNDLQQLLSEGDGQPLRLLLLRGGAVLELVLRLEPPEQLAA